MGAHAVITHAQMQGGGVSLTKITDRAPVSAPMIILGATDGMGGGRELLPVLVPQATRILRARVGKADAMAVVRDALSIPHRDHYADSADGWETYSARVVTGLRVVCVCPADGGFFETAV